MSKPLDAPMIRDGDSLEVMREFRAETMDAVITDPPYGLAFMNRHWDKFESKEFQEWNEEWAREALRVMKPGGHLLAFGATRLFGRLQCAIEDAGFEVRDTLAWLRGNGFPKGRRMAGGRSTHLKPALELIALARKPLSEGRVEDNDKRWGTGLLNIDACRVPVEDGDENPTPKRRASVRKILESGKACAPQFGQNFGGTGWKDKEGFSAEYEADRLGRYPSNVCHDGSEEVLSCFPDNESNYQPDFVRPPQVGKASVTYKIGKAPYPGPIGYGDRGNAARIFYCPKASTAEREEGLIKREDGERANSHPAVKPIELMRWLIRLVVPSGATILDPFMGSGTTLVAALYENVEAIGIEREAEFRAIARSRILHHARVNAQEELPI